MFIDPSYLLKIIKRVWYLGCWCGIGPNPKNVLMTQAEANGIFEGPKIEIENLFSNVGNLILTAIFFHPLFPLSIPLCGLGLLL